MAEAPRDASCAPLPSCVDDASFCFERATPLPIRLLRTMQITVELKNDLAISGTLHSVDQYLNIKLTNTRVVNEQKYPHMVGAPAGRATRAGLLQRCVSPHRPASCGPLPRRSLQRGRLQQSAAGQLSGGVLAGSLAPARCLTIGCCCCRRWRSATASSAARWCATCRWAAASLWGTAACASAKTGMRLRQGLRRTPLLRALLHGKQLPRITAAAVPVPRLLCRACSACSDAQPPLTLPLPRCARACSQLPPGSVDVDLLHDATRREARGA